MSMTTNRPFARTLSLSLIAITFLVAAVAAGAAKVPKRSFAEKFGYDL